mmetsp:Transcript_116735/g.341765  ORF Transcript_116735/g.341765 Transcript_116735/m.341765 type:complete len:478 (-) Transcript_116735:47-1480(-)
MPQKVDGLGYISENFRDLFRELKHPLANKDPVELKPPHRVQTAKREALEVDYYPIGVLCVKIRMPGQKISAEQVAKGEYMKWAVTDALADSIGRVGKIKARPNQILFCAEDVEILDVQMPYLGDNLWQFCEFRFDYKFQAASPEEASKVCQNIFLRMVDFEATFCKALEFHFREIYLLTVMNLINKRFIMMDGKEISDQVALFEAAQQNGLGKMEGLIANGADVNAFQKPARFPGYLLDEDQKFLMVTLGRTPLLGAAEEGHIEAMRLLLNAKANVNFADNSGFHALYLAAGAPETSEKAVNFLLANGAEPNRANSSGYTALHNACGSGELGGVTALLEAKADLNLKSKGGAAPVHVAVINSQPEVLDVLKKFKANLDMPAFGGNTPVHEAVMKNDADMIKKLLDLNADINIESGPEHSFATPLKMAMVRNKKKAMRKLKELGAIEKVEHELEDSSDGEFALADGEFVPKVRGRLLA